MFLVVSVHHYRTMTTSTSENIFVVSFMLFLHNNVSTSSPCHYNHKALVTLCDRSHNFSLKWPGSSLHLSKVYENAHGNITSGSVLVCGLPVSDVIDERIQRPVRMEPVSTAHIPACTRPQHCDTSMAHLAERTNHTLKWCPVCELNHCLLCLDCGSFFKVIKCLNMVFLSLLAEHLNVARGDEILCVWHSFMRSGFVWVWTGSFMHLYYEWLICENQTEVHGLILRVAEVRRYGGIFFSSLCT